MINVDVTNVKTGKFTKEFNELNGMFVDVQDARDAIIDALRDKLGNKLTSSQSKAIEELSDNLLYNSYGDMLGYSFDIVSD